MTTPARAVLLVGVPVVFAGLLWLHPMVGDWEGLRNATISSGDWTATPLDPDGRCGAEQIAVIPGTGAGPPRDTEGGPGQTLSLQVVPKLFSIEMTGACLWQKVNP